MNISTRGRRTVLPAGPASGLPRGRTLAALMAGLMLALLLAALDQTIVSTALPTIVGELGGLHELSYVITAYLLTSAAATPVVGKLGDRHGRKRLLLGAVVVFLFGSALCGQARDIGQLVAFRAVQGVGGGALMALVQASISDVVPLRSRGRYQGLFGGVFGLASVVGPVLGGTFTDHLSWRWCFYVNLPLGLLALAVIARTLPSTPGSTDSRRVPADHLGICLLVAAVTCLVGLTSLGGHTVAWTSPLIAALAVAGVLTVALFVRQERRAPDPLLPLSLLRDSQVALALALTMLVSLAMFGAVVFLPLYLQISKGASATHAGLLLLPMLGGLLTASVLSGRYVSRTGRYRWLPVVGTATASAGIALLSTGTARTTLPVFAVHLAVLGVGLGLTQQTLLLIAQNAAPPRHLGTVTAAVALFRSVGGAFGTALLGSVVTAAVGRSLSVALPNDSAGAPADRLVANPAAVALLPEPVRVLVRDAYAHAVHDAFLVAVPFGLLAVLLTLGLRQRELRHERQGPAR